MESSNKFVKKVALYLATITALASCNENKVPQYVTLHGNTDMHNQVTFTPDSTMSTLVGNNRINFTKAVQQTIKIETLEEEQDMKKLLKDSLITIQQELELLNIHFDPSDPRSNLQQQLAEQFNNEDMNESHIIELRALIDNEDWYDIWPFKEDKIPVTYRMKGIQKDMNQENENFGKSINNPNFNEKGNGKATIYPADETLEMHALINKLFKVQSDSYELKYKLQLKNKQSVDVVLELVDAKRLGLKDVENIDQNDVFKR